MRIPALALSLAAALAVPPMGAAAQAAVTIPGPAEAGRRPAEEGGRHLANANDVLSAQVAAGEQASPPAAAVEEKKGRRKWLLVAGVAVVGAAAILIARRDDGSCLACDPIR